MSTAALASFKISRRDQYAVAARPEKISIALLGLGRIGSAVADLAAWPGAHAYSVKGALVRDTARQRTRPSLGRVPVTTRPETLLDGRPDALIEALGGLEPARGLVLEALQRGIPVVTANKSLVAAHGDELLAASAEGGVPFRYEATVIAGVPFLGAFGRRPLAGGITSIAGIVNGTSNFILSRMVSKRTGYAAALCEAQDLGLAEPDPSRDVRGLDAAEKLCILLRHFGRWSVHPCDLDKSGIEGITTADLEQAAAAGGVVKPIVFATWNEDGLTAFAGPAFLPDHHQLAAVHGVVNAIALGGGPAGDLFHSGPGAGPAVTAATILDDVTEAVAEAKAGRRPAETPAWKPAVPASPATGWFVRVTAASLPPAPDVADLLAAHGIWLKRSSETAERDGLQSRWSWTYPCSKGRIDRALRAVATAGGCETLCLRALEA